MLIFSKRRDRPSTEGYVASFGSRPRHRCVLPLERTRRGGIELVASDRSRRFSGRSTPEVFKCGSALSLPETCELDVWPTITGYEHLSQSKKSMSDRHCRFCNKECALFLYSLETCKKEDNKTEWTVLACDDCITSKGIKSVSSWLGYSETSSAHFIHCTNDKELLRLDAKARRTKDEDPYYGRMRSDFAEEFDEPPERGSDFFEGTEKMLRDDDIEENKKAKLECQQTDEYLKTRKRRRLWMDVGLGENGQLIFLINKEI